MQLDQLTASSLQEAYAYPPNATRAPWVRTNFVATIDGVARGVDGRSASISNADDKRVFALLRSLADVIVVGAGTARAEGYAPVRPDEIDQELRARMGLSALPSIAVVSQSLDIPAALVTTGQLIITTQDHREGRLDQLRDQIEVIAAGHGSIDWPAVLDRLASIGMTRILCEGGPSLHGALVARDLVDEVCVSISPSLEAGMSGRITADPMRVTRPMRLGHVIQADNLLLTRYTRIRT